MKAFRTKQEKVVNKTPRCEFKLLYGSNDRQCSHSSSYNIEGKNYCAMHAGKVALKILLSGGD